MGAYSSNSAQPSTQLKGRRGGILVDVQGLLRHNLTGNNASLDINQDTGAGTEE